MEISIIVCIFFGRLVFLCYVQWIRLYVVKTMIGVCAFVVGSFCAPNILSSSLTINFRFAFAETFAYQLQCGSFDDQWNAVEYS